MKVLQFVYRLAMMTAMLAGMFLAAVANAPVAVADDCTICNAAQWGDISEVKRLLDSGAAVNYPSSSGISPPLIAAVYGGHTEIVKLLLVAGADPNGFNGHNNGLVGAARYGHTEITEMLLAAGADPTLETSYSNKHGVFTNRPPLAVLEEESGSNVEEAVAMMKLSISDPQYLPTLRREHCEWLQDVRCEDNTPEETAAVATEETDYGVLYGSLAWRETLTHYHWYWVLNAADEGEANTDVGNYCDADVGNTTDCKLGGAFNNGCAAIAVGENDGIVIASGDSTFAARREAITFCNESGGVGCKAVDSVCTADVEDKEAAAKAKQEKETGSVAK